MFDEGIYDYKGEFNGKPWYENREEKSGRRQKLYYKENCGGPHWAIYSSLSMNRVNSRTNGKNKPECPEDGKDWKPDTKVKCLDGK